MTRTIVTPDLPDGRLAELAAAGSEAAFEAIVARYRRELHVYGARILRSETRGEDAVQQALLSAWTALRAGPPVRQLRPWLYRITYNQAITLLRRGGDDALELSETAGASDGPEVVLDRRLRMRATLVAVARLPELQRRAILETAVAGESYEAVGDELGMSGTAVRGLVYRARRTIRAAAAALSPAPVLAAAAAAHRRGLSWLSELMPAGVGVGGAGAAVGVKTAAVLATSAVLVGGTFGGSVGSIGLRGSVRPRGGRGTRGLGLVSVAGTRRRVARRAPAVSSAPLPRDSERPPRHIAAQPAHSDVRAAAARRPVDSERFVRPIAARHAHSGERATETRDSERLVRQYARQPAHSRARAAAPTDGVTPAVAADLPAARVAQTRPSPSPSPTATTSTIAVPHSTVVAISR